MAHAASFAWASMLPPRPLRWASRLFGIYLSVGSAAAVVAGVAGIVPGSPLRTLLTAPAPDLLAAPAAAPRSAAAPALDLAEVDGLTVPQARVACGAAAGSTCLIFAPTEPVPPDLLPPD